jgi:hypothetical protein
VVSGGLILFYAAGFATYYVPLALNVANQRALMLKDLQAKEQAVDQEIERRSALPQPAPATGPGTEPVPAYEKLYLASRLARFDLQEFTIKVRKVDDAVLANLAEVLQSEIAYNGGAVNIIQLLYSAGLGLVAVAFTSC